MSVLATEEMSAVETGQMSSVETGQMSAVETGQMSAAETGQMSAVETRKMYSIKTGQRPVATVDICLVPTCTSKDQESSLTFASELFNARWHEERSCFLEALSAAFFWDSL